MVAMDVQLDENATRLLTAEAKNCPREVRRAFYYACGITLRNMRSMMSGKSSKVAKWDDFTKKYRAMATWDSAGVFGGKLMWPDKKKLTMEPEGDRVRIGWIGPLEFPAERFQEGGSEPTTSEWRHCRYKQGFKHGEVPRMAVTPPRPIIAPCIEEGNRHLAEWVLGAYVRILQGKIHRWDVRYTATSATRAGAKAVITQMGSVRRVSRYQALLNESKGLPAWA